jgi:pilus assembly protein Flp/PilA
MSEGLSVRPISPSSPGVENTMARILPSISRFVVSEDGPTAVEYAVMLALILVACITIVTTLGKSISSTFSTVNTTLSSS